ncbi:MAG TPA: hypothetical protein PKM63_22290 [Panacibacter sp.]|nr:hypothetical protein [Panacibacter sp.]HNP47043.1 hypothetical protein [Panacibacter sp.]
MKKTIASGIAVLWFGLLFSQTRFHCPVTGLDKNAHLPSANLVALNKLKNRGKTPTDIDESISLADILAPGNDRNRFSNNKAIKITGFIFNAKAGGTEDCNCFYGKEDFIDTHIEIALSAGETDKKKVMVVEITPRFKALHPEWRTNKILALKGKKVTITGWMFFDEKHWQNSKNSNPRGTNLYRATAWEIHPVTSFEVLD